MRVLVCGCRDWDDEDAIVNALHELAGELDPEERWEMIHGAARGVDSIAGYWGAEIGFHVTEFPAQWDKHGKRAGLLRNQQMLDEGKPDLVLAFWDGKSRGTRDMLGRATRAGVLVRIVARFSLGRLKAAGG